MRREIRIIASLLVCLLPCWAPGCPAVDHRSLDDDDTTAAGPEIADTVPEDGAADFCITDDVVMTFTGPITGGVITQKGSDLGLCIVAQGSELGLCDSAQS